tara:strand:- start:7907 stop:8227 length:321 start_codon:yes stop_codon:yes gene_type:complete
MQDKRYFSNHRGVSIISTEFSYGGREGLYEVAVIAWWEDKKGNKNWAIDYSTEITNDVIGNLTMEDVEKISKRVEKLSSRDNEEPDLLELKSFWDFEIDEINKEIN